MKMQQSNQMSIIIMLSTLLTIQIQSTNWRNKKTSNAISHVCFESPAFFLSAVNMSFCIYHIKSAKAHKLLFNFKPCIPWIDECLLVVTVKFHSKFLGLQGIRKITKFDEKKPRKWSYTQSDEIEIEIWPTALSSLFNNTYE